MQTVIMIPTNNIRCVLFEALDLIFPDMIGFLLVGLRVNGREANTVWAGNDICQKGDGVSSVKISVACRFH
jgi:hypothetical protein